MPSQSSPPGQSHRNTASSVPVFCAAALSLTAFHLIGATYLNNFSLDLGSLNYPTPRYLAFVALWTVFGSVFAILFALGLSRVCGNAPRLERVRAELNALSDRRFLIWTGVAAFAIPLAIRLFLLHGAPLADDESAYRFAAALLASGRLWAPSPEMKLFFDQNFLINDGRLYAVYFLGWPLLLAPGVMVGAPGLINPLLSALTVVPLFRTIESLAGPGWARGGVLLFLSSPFLQMAAATELSHTSCLAALAWCLWMYFRAVRPGALGRDHAAFAFFFAVAFAIRPQSTLPLGLPLLLSWIVTVLRLDGPARWRALSNFLVPAGALGALFLAALWAQNGSPWLIGYDRYAQYLHENKFRFTSFTAMDLTTVTGFDFSQVGTSIARTALAIFRLNYDLFGWPSSLVLLLLALPSAARHARILWAMIASFLLMLMFQRDWGIDTIGPLHAFEPSLPILVLTICGAKNLSERLAWTAASPPDWPSWTFAPALLASLIAAAWLGFAPARLEAVGQIASHVNTALGAPAHAGLTRAIVFSPIPFVPRCPGIPSHFVFFRPVNDPDLRNDILWVNHLSIEQNRQFVRSMGDRPGYVLQWNNQCQVSLRPLEGLTDEDVPPSRFVK